MWGGPQVRSGQMWVDVGGARRYPNIIKGNFSKGWSYINFNNINMNVVRRCEAAPAAGVEGASLEANYRQNLCPCFAQLKISGSPDFWSFASKSGNLPRFPGVCVPFTFRVT